MIRPNAATSRAVWSWALYDFANSPFTTLVITFVYATYFTQAIADDPLRGTAQWSRAITITALIVALASPVLGAIADRGGYRKLFVLIATVICVAATALLYNVLPGQIMRALVTVIVANVAFEFATVFYNAFLPEIAPPGRTGTISGWGWGLGYVGGLIALALALVTLVRPDVPWLGFTKDAGENIRATNLLVAAWFALFSTPLMLWVHEDKSRISRSGRIVADAFVQLGRTYMELRKHREMVKFLFARLVYNDALVTIWAFGGIYAAETFGFELDEVLLFGIVINLFSGVGAVAMGYLDDYLGSKRTVSISLVGLSLATLLAILAVDKVWLWVAGIVIGIFAGPNQASSRALMARFVPPDMENEFFGFFAFSGKLTAFVGPFLLGVLTEVSGSQRYGVLIVLVLFLAGLLLLQWVEEGRRE